MVLHQYPALSLLVHIFAMPLPYVMRALYLYRALSSTHAPKLVIGPVQKKVIICIHLIYHYVRKINFALNACNAYCHLYTCSINGHLLDRTLLIHTFFPYYRQVQSCALQIISKVRGSYLCYFSKSNLIRYKPESRVRIGCWYLIAQSRSYSYTCCSFAIPSSSKYGNALPELCRYR